MNYFSYLSLPLKTYACVLIGSIGLFFGSFLYCLAIRLVTGESYIKGRSHCENCEHVLGIKDLIPLFSWIFLNGKCRYCGKKISAKYPLSEIITAIIYISILLKFGFTIETIKFLVFCSILLCISFADIEGYIIPDELIISGIIARFAFILFSGDMDQKISSLLNTMIGGLSISLPVFILVVIMDKVLKKETMGGGDIKLLFMSGLYFTWIGNLFALLVSCFAGIIYGIYARIKTKNTDNTDDDDENENLIPFGPFISFGAYISLLFGSEIVSYYLSFF